MTAPDITTIRRKVEAGYPLTNTEGAYLLAVLEHASRDRTYWLEAYDGRGHHFAAFNRRVMNLATGFRSLEGEAGEATGNLAGFYGSVAADVEEALQGVRNV